MNRRHFIKTGLIWVPTFIAGRKLVAQPSINRPSAGTFNRPQSGEASSILQQSTGSTGGTNASLANDSTRVYLATQFAASSSYTLTRVDAELKKNNSPTGTVTAYLYSDSGGSPGSLLATSTNTLALNTLTSSFVYYTFLFAGYALTSGTAYHIVLGKTSGSVDGTHYAIWQITTTGGSGVEKSADGSAWTLVGGAYHARADFYGY